MLDNLLLQADRICRVRKKGNCMKKVEIHSAAMFHCPKCHQVNFVREIVYEAAPDATVAGTEIPDGGSAEWPDGWHVCRSCGNELTKQQQKPARPFAPGGGVALPAWFFTCNECGRDNFLSVTIYYGDGAQGPPTKVACVQCRAEFEQDQDDGD